MLQALIDKSQEHVSGTVRMKLYKGNAAVSGRESQLSLYDQDLVTFEEGTGGYDQRDAASFIRLHAPRPRNAARGRDLGTAIAYGAMHSSEGSRTPHIIRKCRSDSP